MCRILACYHFRKISSHEDNFCQLTFVWSGRAFQRKHWSKPHQSLNPKFLNICVYGYNRNSSKSDWAIHLTKSPNLVCFYLFLCHRLLQNLGYFGDFRNFGPSKMTKNGNFVILCWELISIIHVYAAPYMPDI